MYVLLLLFVMRIYIVLSSALQEICIGKLFTRDKADNTGWLHRHDRIQNVHTEQNIHTHVWKSKLLVSDSPTCYKCMKKSRTTDTVV